MTKTMQSAIPGAVLSPPGHNPWSQSTPLKEKFHDRKSLCRRA